MINQKNLIEKLAERFKAHPDRHVDITWQQVLLRIQNQTQKLKILQAMEQTGGEPDVIAFERSADHYCFVDCSEQSPMGRRSLCYDRAAHEARKEFKPQGNVIDTAQTMGIELLNEAQYRHLQTFGEFDSKTSSWLLTPVEIRKRDGAIFGDCRYGQVFIYHNGVQSYYAARGFRGLLKI